MKANIILFSLALCLVACSKDDSPQLPEPYPIQQPDPVPENRAPGTFELISPGTDAQDAHPAPVFRWNTATDPDGDRVAYNLYVDTTEVPQTIIAENLNTTTFVLEDRLGFNTKYHWQVVAKDPKGAKTESAVESFTTDLPIEFLKEFSVFSPNSMGESIQRFVYTNGIVDAYELTKTRWATTYDTSSNKLSALRMETSGEFITYTYKYTAFGEQQSVQRERSAKTEYWTMDYEGQQLASVLYRSNILGGEFTATSTFQYPDGETSKPFKIKTEVSGLTAFHVMASVRTLEWEGDTIVSVTTEREAGSYIREEYTYDDNINPYNTLIKNQFGFNNFFVLHNNRYGKHRF